MEELIKNNELAEELLAYLDLQAEKGCTWVVYDSDNPLTGSWDLHCFSSSDEALDFEREYQQIFNWHIAVPIDDLRAAIKATEYLLKNKTMNRNSLEDFRDHVKNLKIPKEMADKAEEMMEKNIQFIKVIGQLPSKRGYMEATLHLKRSENSDYYYLNKYDLAYSKAKPLENGLQYIVAAEFKIDGVDKPSIRKFDSPIQAIDDFKSVFGNAELMTGKVVDGKLVPGQSLATMKNDKVDYVTKDFDPVFKNPPMKNTIYINEGKGFNMRQGANMLMGGSAFRDDLVSRQGVRYEAWNTYQFDAERDRYGNLAVRQYGEGYGFDLKKELESYKIKELEDPKRLDHVVSEMKDGERPVVSVTNEQGDESKMMVRAMPRYGNLNFYDLDGKVHKREQFLKEPKQELSQGNSQSKKQGKEQSQGQAMGM